MATPTLLSVSNVALPNTADSGNVSVTAPTGANACVIGGTFYVSDNSVVTSLTGSQLTTTTNGGLRTATASGGNYMSSYAQAFQVTATGSQTIRLQKTGGYAEGPTCQIAWLTVDDPTDFVRTGGFLIDSQNASPDTLTVTINSATTDLVLGMFGTDGSSADPSAPTGTTQQGTLQTTQFDKSVTFTVNSPGASTTTITAGSRAYPTLFGISLKAGSSGPTNYKLTCDVGAYATTGIAAALRRGYSMTAVVGVYSLTGQDAQLRRGYSLAAVTGGYTLTGIDATLVYVANPTNYSLTCDVGAYSITGHDAILNRGYSLAASVGSYSLTGEDATLIYTPGAANYSLSCDVGAYALTGYDANLTYSQGTTNYTLSCDTGVYTLTGNAAVTSAGRRIGADVGAYSSTGQAAGLVFGRRLVADTGAYSLTGHDATLTATVAIAYTLSCETGDYSLTGNNADLIYPGGVQPQIGVFWPPFWWYKNTELEEELEKLAPDVKETLIEAAEKTVNDEPVEIRAVLKKEKIRYRNRYKEIYLQIVEEMRQSEEDEEIAVITAFL